MHNCGLFVIATVASVHTYNMCSLFVTIMVTQKIIGTSGLYVIIIVRLFIIVANLGPHLSVIARVSRPHNGRDGRNLSYV